MMENNIPHNWVLINLFYDVDFVATGVKEFDGKKEYYSTGSIQDNSHISEGQFDFASRPSRANRIAQKGDIFQARMKNTDKALLIDDKLDGSLFSSGFIQLRPFSDSIVNEYLYYFTRSKIFLDQKDFLATGSTQEALTDRGSKKIVMPLAPKNEQIRIIQKLNSIFKRINLCQSKLNKFPQVIKSLRQSVLDSAVNGNITRDWRKNNPTNELSSKIIEDFVAAKRNINPKLKLDLTNDKSFDIPLPETWCWTRLINIADVAGGITKGKRYNGKSTILIPYLRVANVQDGYLDLKEIKYIDALPQDLLKYKLQKGDILFTEGGDRDKLGRGTIWNDEIESCIHQNHIFRARTDNDKFIPEYISIFTKTEIAKDYFFANASQTVNLASINLTALSSVPIALPPTSEQKVIVEKVGRLLSAIDNLEVRFSKLSDYVEDFSKNILNKAFTGQLTNQNSKDEPVEELLKVISDEKELLNNFSREKTINPPKPKINMKEELEKIIRDFDGQNFTFEDVLENTRYKYQDIVKEFLKLVSSENSDSDLLMSFNENKNSIEFKSKIS